MTKRSLWGHFLFHDNLMNISHEIGRGTFLVQLLYMTIMFFTFNIEQLAADHELSIKANCYFKGDRLFWVLLAPNVKVPFIFLTDSVMWLTLGAIVWLGSAWNSWLNHQYINDEQLCKKVDVEPTLPWRSLSIEHFWLALMICRHWYVPQLSIWKILNGAAFKRQQRGKFPKPSERKTQKIYHKTGSSPCRKPQAAASISQTCP